MNLTGTHINYFRLCKRKLWLFANEISMETTSDLVYDGKIIEEETYQRRSEKYTQIELTALYYDISLAGKIDFYNLHNKTVYETKRSNKVEDAHIWQVKFYLWLLRLNEIETEKGVIEYPKMRITEEIVLDDKDISYLEKTVLEIRFIIESEICPPIINAKICKSCSYYDFCYVGD